MASGLGIMTLWVTTFVVRGHGTPAPFLVGYALCGVSFAALLVAFAMLAVVHLVAVLYEEPSLARRFGEPNREYRRTTPRWTPRRPRAGTGS